MSKYLLDSLINNAGQLVPDLFNSTYHKVDEKLSELADTQGSSSGCTAVTVFLRLEDEAGKPVAHAESGGIDKNSRLDVKTGGAASKEEGQVTKETGGSATDGEGPEKSHSGGVLSSIARRMRHSSNSSNQNEGTSEKPKEQAEAEMGEDGLMQVQGKEVRRVLYTANVGDARAVLW